MTLFTISLLLGALEWKPGHDYYFISTSSEDDLHRRLLGMCHTKNMRIVFRVADGRERNRKNNNNKRRNKDRKKKNSQQQHQQENNRDNSDWDDAYDREHPDDSDTFQNRGINNR